MAKSYFNQDFVDSKLVELLEAAKNLKGFNTEKEIEKWTSLGNNMKKCYLAVGILVEGEKQGKMHTYKLDAFKITPENIKEAYNKKNLLKGNKELTKRNIKWEKLCKNGFDKYGNILPDKEEVTHTKTEDLFPSIDDCLKYLQHHYGVDVEVIPVKTGYTVDSYTCKKK